MLTTRYSIAAEYSRGRRILEVGCGAGMGLGCLRRSAAKTIGGDYSEGLLARAHSHYGNAMPLLRFDAEALPFRSACFDVVILYEAIYYLPHAERFVSEARRVLRPGGMLIVSSANREWPAFNPSPLSTRYWSARELEQLMRSASFDVRLGGAFPADMGTARDKSADRLRRLAIGLGLMPRTMKGKELFKRLFLGSLIELPEEIPEHHQAASQITALSVEQSTEHYKVIYAFGHVPSGHETQ